MKNVIFGASGFLGSHLLNYSKKHQDLVLPIARSWHGSFTFDTLNRVFESNKHFYQKSNVIYCAGPTPVKNLSQLKESIQLLDLVLEFYLDNFENSKFIYVSSDSVYADGKLINESNKLEPSTYHGFAHQLNEFNLKERCMNMNFQILRPVALFGSGDTHNSFGPNRFIREAIKTGKINIFQGADNIREHIWVHDAVMSIYKVISSKERIINIAFGEAYSFKYIAKLIKDNFKRKLDRDIILQINYDDVPPTEKSFDPTLLETVSNLKIKSSFVRGVNELGLDW
jgi:UDP-glucose 4-epimerase